MSPVVGVLLPVRLETRFVAPVTPAGRWRLRLRVVPDAISITTHDPVPSAFELDRVEEMWRTAGATDLETPDGRRAWRALVSAVGIERAAWLARTFVPVVGPSGEFTVERPTVLRDNMRRSRLHGLPPTIEIWIGRGTRPPGRAATLIVTVNDTQLDLTDPDTPDEPWFTSFPEAVAVGLATEIDLGVERPDDIDVVYAVGVGGGDPGPLLTAHGDSGRLGLVHPGTATSTVDGRPAASLGDDPDEARRLLRVDARSQAGVAAVTGALRASGSIVGGVPGGNGDHRPLNRALVRATWPALWGHSIGNIWADDRVDAIGRWAGDNLVPEGPLPALRVGDQPYGLLPATSLATWKPAAGDPAVEVALVPLVASLVARWAASVDGGPSSGRRDPFDVMLRAPTASKYVWRWLMPVEVAHAMSFRFGDTTRFAEVERWWGTQTRSAARLGPVAGPARRMVSVGWSHDIEVELVSTPGDGGGAGLRAALARLRVMSPGKVLDTAFDLPGAPSSLLLELIRHSVVASAAGVRRVVTRRPRAIVEPLSADAAEPGELEALARAFTPNDLAGASGDAGAVHRNVIDAIDVLVKEPTAELERGLRATLDAATSRIDPWATAIAWRRLQSMARAPRSLGVYGWVDAPRPRLTPHTSEFMLAPSAEQATVAAVLRDRARRDPDATRWHMDINSAAVQSALRFTSDVRGGANPPEALGRLVEKIASSIALVDLLRAEFPSRPAVAARRLKIRRTTNGAAVLSVAIEQPGRLQALGLSAAKVAELQALAAAVDVLGDLTVAESVYGVVRGRPNAAAAVSAGVSGTGRPPTLDVLTTPRHGRHVTSVVIVVLPGVVASPGPDPSPMALADSAVTAHLDERSGAANGPDWTWTVLDDAGVPTGNVTLADLDCRPSDTLGFGRDALTQLVLDLTGAPGVVPGPASGHDRVRAWAAALAGLPAVIDDVSDAIADAAATEDGRAELAARYATVHAAALDTLAQLAAVDSNATPTARRAALRLAARWGITPLATTSGDAMAAQAELEARVGRAGEALRRRLEAAPTPAEATGESARRLGELIAALVAPEAPCPIFGRVPATACAALVSDGGPAPLYPDWMDVVAPVRPAVARLESVQLDESLRPAGSPLEAWTNRPGDTWQTVLPPTDNEVPRPSRLIAAFGPPATLPAAQATVAAAVIDRFIETIPDTHHDAAIAFDHELPTARAPQAILLAVPPVADQDLNGETLVGIVAETRQLVRARLADPAQVGPDATVLHLAALSAIGPGAIRVGRHVRRGS